VNSSMTCQMIGDFWAIVVLKSEALGQPYHGQGTFGYDSQKKKYIDTWTDSMSEFLWYYHPDNYIAQSVPSTATRSSDRSSLAVLARI
jgi:hypothetical protein